MILNKAAIGQLPIGNRRRIAGNAPFLCQYYLHVIFAHVLCC